MSFLDWSEEDKYTAWSRYVTERTDGNNYITYPLWCYVMSDGGENLE